jgi:hypothetical protein
LNPCRRGAVALLLSLSILLLTGCNAIASKERALAAVDTFHQQLNAGDLDAIWNGADEAFRAAAPRDTFDKFVGAVHRKLGRAVQTSGNGWTINSHNFQTRVVLKQRTQFEHGNGVETFTFVVHGDEVRLVGYNIESMDLVTT